MAPDHDRREAENYDNAVLAAQYRMLAKHLPVIYTATLASGMLVAELFSHHTPPHVLFPALTLSTCITVIRLSYWLRVRTSPDTRDSMRATVQQAPWFAALHFGLISYWVVSILPYGNGPEQLTALVFLALVTSGGVAFNTHLPKNIYVITAVGTVPLAIALIQIDAHLGFTMAAICVISIAGQIVYARHQHRSFLAAVRSRIEAENDRREAEHARRDMARVADTDALTGIPNRRAFLASLGQLTTRLEPFGVAIVDLNGFKPINDLYGHTAGDNVLFTVANRLKAAVGERGTVARLAGDEFGVLITRDADTASILALGKSLVQSIERPIALEECVVRVSLSCGIAAYPDTSLAPMRLLEQAVQAVSFAKRSGHGHVAMYDGEVETQEARRNLVESRLRTAIIQQSFDLAYQPIRHLSSSTITSYEALARWTDEHLGMVSPGEFIPIAEQTGLIGDLADILFQRAVQEACQWPSDIALSFNLSSVQFQNPNIAFKILSTLTSNGFPPTRLLLEITETAVLKDLDHAQLVIAQLRKTGIRIALDDFGVGYAGFGYVDRLTFDKLKVDRSFVNGMKDNARKRQIVSAIVDMCHRLDMTCVAEGIEEQDELDFLESIGCDSGQGYYLGRPGPAPSSLRPALRPAAVA